MGVGLMSKVTVTVKFLRSIDFCPSVCGIEIYNSRSTYLEKLKFCSHVLITKTVITKTHVCKLKHLQNIYKNVLVFYFTCNQRKTFAKHLNTC